MQRSTINNPFVAKLKLCKITLLTKNVLFVAKMAIFN